MFRVTGLDGLAGSAPPDAPVDPLGAVDGDPPVEVLVVGVVVALLALPVLGDEQAVNVTAAHAATTATPRSVLPRELLTEYLIDGLLESVVK
jgi:hypothetical protein